MRYIYRARDKQGKLITGTAEADNHNEVVHSLREQGYLPIVIKQPKNIRLFFLKLGERIPLFDIITFSRQLSFLLRAGIPFLAGISVIRDQIENRKLKEVLGGIIKGVEKGSFFSAALAKYEGIFGRTYVSMVKTAEAAGTLDAVLERLADMGEKEREIRDEIKSAAAYPMMVISVMFIAFIVLFAVIVPQFMKIYSQFGIALPAPTLILMMVSVFIRSFWHLIFIALVILIVNIKLFMQTYRGRFLWESLQLKLPVAGPLILKIVLSRFARIVSMLTKSGVPIVNTLDLAQEGVGNFVVGETIAGIAHKITQGQSLSATLKEVKLFPPLVMQMITVGEESGKLDELLSFVSEYYEQQVKYALKNLVKYIEPILIIILSLGVLLIAMGVFLPMWNLTQIIG